MANTGDVDTGAFITGSYSNGFLVSGDYQGLIGLPLLGIPVTPGYFNLTGGRRRASSTAAPEAYRDS